MINPDHWLMISVAVLFLFLLGSLNKILFKPMSKHIDARKKSLKENQNSASQSSGDAAEFDEEAAKILAEAKKQAHSNIEEVVSLQKKENESLLNVERGKVEEEMKSFLQTLEAEKEEIKKVIADNAEVFKSGIKAKLTV